MNTTSTKEQRDVTGAFGSVIHVFIKGKITLRLLIVYCPLVCTQA